LPVCTISGEVRGEMSEEEYNVRFVEIKVGANDELSGVSVFVRDDTADIEKLAKIVLELYKQISGSRGGKKDEQVEIR